MLLLDFFSFITLSTAQSFNENSCFSNFIRTHRDGLFIDHQH